MKLNEVAGNRVLKTKKGSPIKRSRFGVGKEIGGQLYLHRNYIKDLPDDLKDRALKAYTFVTGAEFNTIKISLKDPTISFINSPDFDSAPEPTVGEYVYVDVERNIIKRSKNSSIWHHKWLWVKDDYTGFDVEESFNRSKEYLKMDIDFSRIGNKEFWEKNYAERL